MKQLQLTSASHASDSTIEMAGKDYNGKSNDGYSKRYAGSNNLRQDLEYGPSKSRHRYYPFVVSMSLDVKSQNSFIANNYLEFVVMALLLLDSGRGLFR